MKPADMSDSEYRAKFVMATVCYAAMLTIISFFVVNLLTQGLDSGWPHAKTTPAAGRYVVNFLIIVAVFWVLTISVNALYLKSRTLFLELGFELRGGLILLQRDMKRMGIDSGSAVQTIRDYYWLSLVFIVICLFSIFSLSFFPSWVAFIVMAGFLNIFSRGI